jgi:hypothetical protein
MSNERGKRLLDDAVKRESLIGGGMFGRWTSMQKPRSPQAFGINGMPHPSSPARQEAENGRFFSSDGTAGIPENFFGGSCRYFTFAISFIPSFRKLKYQLLRR